MVFTPEVPTSLGWASSNWSGYAITGGPFTSITGSWVVPAVKRTSRASFQSEWIGIDGFSNSDLIQTGTASEYYGGRAHYYAWWEILPAFSTPITGLDVHPGDHMSASITEVAPATWSIYIRNDSTGGDFTILQSYSGPGASAEWVVERPFVNGSLSTLANYGQTTVDPGTANGLNPFFSSSDGGVMRQGRKVISTPSNPDSDTDGFNARYGSKQPKPPGT